MLNQLSLTQVSDEMKSCIQNCLDCHSICLNTIQYCLQKGGEHAEPTHLRLLQDCAQICQTSADFMLRTSGFHHETCAVCATLCDACAKSCESMGNDIQMKACAQVCRRCAEICRSMSTSRAA